MDELDVKKNDKNAIRIGVLILALLWVVVMNNILGNNSDTQNITGTTNNQTSQSSESSSDGLNRSIEDITRDIAISECPIIDVSQAEIDILNSILNLSQVQENLTFDDSFYEMGTTLDYTLVQDVFVDLYPTLSIYEFYAYGDSFGINGQDFENNIGFSLQYSNQNKFDKIIFTVGDEFAPYYTNENNQNFSKIVFS